MQKEEITNQKNMIFRNQFQISNVNNIHMHIFFALFSRTSAK